MTIKTKYYQLAEIIILDERHCIELTTLIFKGSDARCHSIFNRKMLVPSMPHRVVTFKFWLESGKTSYRSH